jgi:hypothetical protein
VATVVGRGVPVLIGVDEPIERRWGPTIIERGSDRDPGRSSQSHRVKASALRWVCRMRSVDMPWVGRAWALPFLSVLAPSARSDHHRGRIQRTVLDKAAALVRWVRGWLPERAVVLVGAGAYAAAEFAAERQPFQRPVPLLSRFYLAAAW